MSADVRIKQIATGNGASAQKGDMLVLSLEAFLPKGEIAFRDDHLVVELGKRRVFPGLEKSLLEMKAGEIREVHVPPHLAYGVLGTSNIPPNASLKLVIKLLRLERGSEQSKLPGLK